MEEGDKKITRNNICQLNTEHYLSVKRYIASQVKNPNDVEDLTQSVFLEFYKKDNHRKEYNSPEAYILKIAQDAVALYHRKRNRQLKTISIESIDEIADNDVILGNQNAEKHARLQELTKLIQAAELPPKARQALILRFIKGYSIRDSAKKAGCSVNAFYQRIARGVKAIRKLKNNGKTYNTRKYQKYLRIFLFCNYWLSKILQAIVKKNKNLDVRFSKFAQLPLWRHEFLCLRNEIRTGIL